MKSIIKNIALSVFTLLAFSCSDDDDGSTTTGNTQEYFKYTIDGQERIFDYEVEAHLETNTSTIIHRYEINASGQQPSGDLRRIGASFSFDGTGTFMPLMSYNWGLAEDNTPTARFHFAESTSSNLFLISGDFNAHPIVATVSSTNPVNIGDYIEFTFSGTFTDSNNATRNISGVCRVQRDADQNY
jgi:hypothetical protein